MLEQTDRSHLYIGFNFRLFFVGSAQQAASPYVIFLMDLIERDQNTSGWQQKSK